MLWQPSLPEKYLKLSSQELGDAIAARRSQLGSSLVILGHHYQTDEILRHADFTGDSLKLSQLAADVASKSGKKGETRYVIFCGVHFMAESADMLTPESVGEHGGACCTSSNAKQVLQWAFAGGTVPRGLGEEIKVLFLPDQHLGRNTTAALGFNTDAQTCVYDPRLARKGEVLGGATAEQLRKSVSILWAGHCSVHKLFRPEHCRILRDENAKHPQAEPIQILVHPECTKEVVDLADLNGSTEFIIKTICEAPTGSRWAVGTEVHLVNRIAREAQARGVHVRILSECQCLCTTMFRIDQPHVLWVLDNLAGIYSKDGSPKVVNAIKVHPEVRRLALSALDRMLALSPEKNRQAALAKAD